MLLGHIGGMLLTLSSIPQIVKLLQTKSSRDISFFFILLMFLGRLCWLCHGHKSGDTALMVWNIIGIFLTLVLLILKIHFDQKQENLNNTAIPILFYHDNIIW